MQTNRPLFYWPLLRPFFFSGERLFFLIYAHTSFPQRVSFGSKKFLENFKEVSQMSYIICAEVYLDEEINQSGSIEMVDARILSRDGGKMTFDIRGEFGRQKELARKLCNTLIDAGFYEFEIRHSY
jgi:hypothetical protein